MWLDWAHLIDTPAKTAADIKDDLKNTIQQGSFPTAASSCPEIAQGL